MEVLKTSRWFRFFKSYPKKQTLRFYSSNVACQQYWSSEKNCLELKVFMSKVLAIRNSRSKVSCKNGVPKNSAKLIEKYPRRNKISR